MRVGQMVYLQMWANKGNKLEMTVQDYDRRKPLSFLGLQK